MRDRTPRSVLGLFLVLIVPYASAQPSSGPHVPAPLATFLGNHAQGKGPWHVTVRELGPSGTGTLGHAVKNTGELAQPIVVELVAALANDASFDASVYGAAGPRCMGATLGLRLERDGARLDLEFSCGRLQVGEHGASVGVSPTLYALMGDVEAWTMPCAPIVIDELDIAVCMPRGAVSGGGPPSSRLLVRPRSPCPDLVIGTAPPKDPKYLRKVGTFELSCIHRDVPACIKVCDTLEPLPHSTATEKFPSGPPVIDMLVTWPSGSGVSIWSDGTVLFAGRRCKKVRSQRGAMNVEELKRLLADIKATGFLTAKNPPQGGHYDGRNMNLKVTVDAQSNEMHLINDARSPEASAVVALIGRVVGKNPCE